MLLRLPPQFLKSQACVPVPGCHMVLEGKATKQVQSTVWYHATPQLAGSVFTLELSRNPLCLQALGVSFQLLHPRELLPPSHSWHAPSLALSDSVLIAAIKPPHHIGDETLIFIRLSEELRFFLSSPLAQPPSSSGSVHCTPVCGTLRNLLLQMQFASLAPFLSLGAPRAEPLLLLL